MSISPVPGLLLHSRLLDDPVGEVRSQLASLGWDDVPEQTVRGAWKALEPALHDRVGGWLAAALGSDQAAHFRALDDARDTEGQLAALREWLPGFRDLEFVATAAHVVEVRQWLIGVLEGR